MCPAIAVMCQDVATISAALPWWLLGHLIHRAVCVRSTFSKKNLTLNNMCVICVDICVDMVQAEAAGFKKQTDRKTDMTKTKTIVVIHDGYEFRVPGPDFTEASAYYTDDRQDARDTAKAMHGDAIKIRFKQEG